MKEIVAIDDTKTNMLYMLDAIWIQSQYACCDAQYACCTIFSAKWTLVLNPSDLEENYPYCICIYIAVQ